MNRTALLHIAALTAFPILATGASAAPMFGPLDFESSGHFDDNFYLSYTSNGTAFQTDPADGEPNNDYLRIPGSGANSTAATVVLNTTAGTKSTSNADTFGSSFTLTFDLSTNMPDSDLDLYLFDTTSASNNLIVSISTSYGADETVSFARDGNFNATDSGHWTGFSGTSTTGDYLPSVSDTEADAGQNFTSVTLTYKVNPGDNAGATLTLEIGSFSTTLLLEDNTHVIMDPGIAIRNRSYNVAKTEHAWRIDNIAVVPEPGMIGLLPAVGVLAMRRRRGDC